MLLEECKYVAKEKKIPKYIIDNIEISSDFNEYNSDEENTDVEILKKIKYRKILMKKTLVKKILVKEILMKKKLIFFLHT